MNKGGLICNVVYKSNMKLPLICLVLFLIALFEFLILLKHDIFKNALIERGFIKQNPEERMDYQCLLGWENSLVKMNYKADVCFIGNSITYGSDFQKDFPNKKIVNLGYSGDRIEGMIIRQKQISAVKPDKIFVMAGINDLSKSYMNDKLFHDSFCDLVDSIQNNNPTSRLYLQSILPVNHKMNTSLCSSERILKANLMIKEIAEKRNAFFIDLYSLYADDNNELPEKYTYDGLHLYPNSYDIWRDAIRKYMD